MPYHRGHVCVVEVVCRSCGRAGCWEDHKAQRCDKRWGRVVPLAPIERRVTVGEHEMRRLKEDTMKKQKGMRNRCDSIFPLQVLVGILVFLCWLSFQTFVKPGAIS
ncbi:unnamed protein product [Hapterophycus canaliculatus]